MPMQAWQSRFDVILFSGLMEKVRDPWQLMFRLHDCLTPRGLLVGRFHNVAHYKLIRRLARDDWRYEPGGVLDHSNLRFFSRGSLEDLLTYAGFELVSMESLGSEQPVWRAAAGLSARARELSTGAYVITAKARPRRVS
jgi:hypothetical protein